MRIKTSSKNFILDVGMEEEQKQELGWKVSVLPIPEFHCTYTVYMQHIMAHSGEMQEWVIQIPSVPIHVSVLFPSLHLKYVRIKICLYVRMIIRTYVCTKCMYVHTYVYYNYHHYTKLQRCGRMDNNCNYMQLDYMYMYACKNVQL